MGLKLLINNAKAIYSIKFIIFFCLFSLSSFFCFSLGFFEIDAPPLEVRDTEKKELNDFVESFYSFFDSDIVITKETTKSWFYNGNIHVVVRPCDSHPPELSPPFGIFHTEGVQAGYKMMERSYGKRESINLQETLFFKHIYDDPTPVFMISYKVIYGETEIVERFYITNVNGKYEIKDLFLFD